MKKLILVLLLAFVIVGFASAFDDNAHPPGYITLNAENITCFGAACGCPAHQVTVMETIVTPVSIISIQVIDKYAEYEKRIILWRDLYKKAVFLNMNMVDELHPNRLRL